MVFVRQSWHAAMPGNCSCQSEGQCPAMPLVCILERTFHASTVNASSELSRSWAPGNRRRRFRHPSSTSSTDCGPLLSTVMRYTSDVFEPNLSRSTCISGISPACEPYPCEYPEHQKQTSSDSDSNSESFCVCPSLPWLLLLRSVCE